MLTKTNLKRYIGIYSPNIILPSLHCPSASYRQHIILLKTKTNWGPCIKKCYTSLDKPHGILPRKEKSNPSSCVGVYDGKIETLQGCEMKTLRVFTNRDSNSLKISQEIMVQIRLKRQWKLAEARQVLFSLVLLSKSTEPISISCTHAL